MKNKKLFYLLLITAILSSLAVILKFSFSEIFTHMVCFPFEQISVGLRWLSLQGGLQNAAAIAIYITFCLIPFLAFLPCFNKKSVKVEHNLLVVLSLLLFYVMYMLINPGLMPWSGTFVLENNFIKILLCGTIYSVIFTYIVLRTIRIFYSSETKNLHKYMIILLSLTAMLYTISIFGIELNQFFMQLETIKNGNEGTERGISFTFIFMIINFVVNNAGSLSGIAVIFAGIKFAEELNKDPYSEGTIAASEYLSRVCKFGLIITVCCSTAFNILQLLFMTELRNINTLVQIPLFSIVFVLGMLILSRLVMVNKIIKDDYDSII